MARGQLGETGIQGLAVVLFVFILGMLPFFFAFLLFLAAVFLTYFLLQAGRGKVSLGPKGFFEVADDFRKNFRSFALISWAVGAAVVWLVAPSYLAIFIAVASACVFAAIVGISLGWIR